MKPTDIIAILNLLNIPRIGPQRVRNLISVFPDVADIFSLTKQQLCTVDGIDLKNAESILNYKDFDYGKREFDKAEKLNISIISFWDKTYPFLLKKIFDPPVLLYTKGCALAYKEDCIAVVGTRAVTSYGVSVTKTLVEELVAKGLTIVSGLARGVDTVAHQATVKNKGRTIAVLGSGLDRIYPPENRQLASEIEERGTLVSEFAFGTKPDAGNFPMRNRIISGLSHGTVVIEAGNRSGAILTALNAVDQNREVFAVPGRIYDKQSQGCLRLIRNGAVPVSNAKQIIKQLGNRLFKPLSPIQQTIELDITPEQSQVVRHLSHDPIHVDDLALKTDLDITKLLAILLELELTGVVQQLSGKQFILAR